MIWVEDTGVATSPVGADGGATGVVAVAVPDGVELPPAFVARTRYEYVVPPLRPVSEKLVVVLVPAVFQLPPPFNERSTS